MAAPQPTPIQSARSMHASPAVAVEAPRSETMPSGRESLRRWPGRERSDSRLGCWVTGVGSHQQSADIGGCRSFPRCDCSARPCLFALCFILQSLIVLGRSVQAQSLANGPAALRICCRPRYSPSSCRHGCSACTDALSNCLTGHMLWRCSFGQPPMAIYHHLLALEHRHLYRPGHPPRAAICSGLRTEHTLANRTMLRELTKNRHTTTSSLLTGRPADHAVTRR